MGDTDITFVNPAAVDRLFALRRESRIGWRTLAVGVALGNYLDGETGQGWAARSTLAKICGVAISHISEEIRTLKKTGFITTEARSGKPNGYCLTPTQNGTGTETGRGPLPETGEGPLPETVPNTRRTRSQETSASRKTASTKRKTKPKPEEHPVWKLWLEVNLEGGRDVPLPEKPSLKAAVELAKLIPDISGQRAIMTAYLKADDPWTERQGKTLAVLLRHRLSQSRAAAKANDYVVDEATYKRHEELARQAGYLDEENMHVADA